MDPTCHPLLFFLFFLCTLSSSSNSLPPLHELRETGHRHRGLPALPPPRPALGGARRSALPCRRPGSASAPPLLLPHARVLPVARRPPRGRPPRPPLRRARRPPLGSGRRGRAAARLAGAPPALLAVPLLGSGRRGRAAARLGRPRLGPPLLPLPRARRCHPLGARPRPRPCSSPRAASPPAVLQRAVVAPRRAAQHAPFQCRSSALPALALLAQCFRAAERDGRPTPSKWVGVVRSIWTDHSDPDLQRIYLFWVQPNPSQTSDQTRV